jgi:hypothetical protein
MTEQSLNVPIAFRDTVVADTQPDAPAIGVHSGG